MEWQHPQWLYLILPLAAAWLGLAVHSRRRRLRAAAAFVARPMWPRILPADSPGRFWAKTLLRELALVAGLVALAGPRFGTQYEEVVPKGSDLYVLIDVSRSMLAQDVPPSRLGRAKADVASLVNRLEGERLGLIAFAGQAVVKCPLTVDYDAFRRSLDELDPDSAPRGGTAIGDAIRKALEVFQARADRDQAILLITDGDDQQSYPREAAAVAAERHVTIFTVGLGDADHGARIPQASNSGSAKSYLEYHGQTVWSKLDGTVLKDIALKTSGIYVPVGTRAYDLGELYTKYLQGRRGADEQAQRRIRRADRFQVFLALAVVALLADALTRPYPRPTGATAVEPGRAVDARDEAGARIPRHAAPVATALALLAAWPGASRAANPAESVREGLRLYSRGEFARAGDRFAAAREQLDRNDPAKAAIAAFDQACAAHRKGDVARAREWYLKAGLARDKRLAASAHFNLGTLAAEEARRLAGDHPETVPPEKRPEILDQLRGAVASFRHCLELEPDNASARRDIELVRQWVKYYGDRWHAHDREKRRRETNLLAFVEYLMESETALAGSARSLAATAPADAYLELKRAQDELREEIGPLKEKIKAELQPPNGAGAPQANPRELQQGLELLQGWAGAAGQKMESASRQLEGRRAAPAAADQQAAVDELEKLWEAVIPFHPLLARDLADQGQIAQALAPASAVETTDESEKREREGPAKPAQGPGPATIGTESADLAPVARLQERTRRRTQLLKLKAEAERERLETSPPSPAQAQPKDKDAPSGGQGPDPAQLKAGYQKAVELAPRAVEQMDHALKALRQKDRQAAAPPAEEARKILEAIQKAQPKDQDKPPDQKPQQEPKKDEEPKKQEPKDQKKDESKKDQKKDESKSKKDESKKDESKKDANKSQGSGKPDAQKKEQPQPQVARDQIESVLRKVRERQQEKRERDRLMMKVRALGRAPVEKDW